MKNNFKILALLVVGLCVLQNAFGQVNKEDNEKFRQLRDKSREIQRESKSSRVTTKREIFGEDGKTIKKKVVMIDESLAPDRQYSKVTIEAGGVTNKYEFISIGGSNYARENDGKWTVPTPEPSVSMIGVGMSTGGKFIERTTLNGQSVVIYEEKSSTSAGGVDTSTKTRYWFTEDGRLLKEERDETSEKTNEASRVVVTYEYDVKIKIETPVD